MRRYDDPVEVCGGVTEGPEQFLWRGRLWQVRDVVAHWVETGSWWVRPAATDSPERGVGPSPAASRGDLLREREVWRVEAARGRAVSAEHDPGFGVFDLVFSWSDGSWRLARALD